jgi:hypothetical protein
MNCSSSVRSSRNDGRNRNSLSRLLIRILCTATDLFGLATNTCFCQYMHTHTHTHSIAFITTNLEDVEALVVDHLPIVPQ